MLSKCCINVFVLMETFPFVLPWSLLFLCSKLLTFHSETLPKISLLLILGTMLNNRFN